MTPTPIQGADCGNASGNALCTRPAGHPGVHYDTTVGLAWTADDPPAGLLSRVDELTARLAERPAPDREHIVTVPPAAMNGLRAWLERPNGGHNIGRVTFEAVAHGGIFVRTRPYGQDAAPERCGQRHTTLRENLPSVEFVCSLAAEHSGEFHRSDDGSTWSHAGNLQGPPSLQYDACGARLDVDRTNATREARDRPQVDASHVCALGVAHGGMRHRSADGVQWSAMAHPDTAGTVMDAQTARHYAELVRLAAPSEDGALNLGPIIERQRLATNDRHYHNDIAASQADVLPLVREVMRLRCPKPAMPGDAVLRSALSGFSEQLDRMTRVFDELRDAVDSTDRLREAVRAEIVATVHYGHTPTLDECTHHQCVALRKAAAA